MIICRTISALLCCCLFMHGLNASDTTEPAKEFQLPVPVISPPTDVFSTTIEISFSRPCHDSCCAKAFIIYTKDGSDPRSSSGAITYQTPFTISSSRTIKAFLSASDGCGKNSDLMKKDYTLIEPLPVPMVSPMQGKVPFGQMITIGVEGFERDSTVLIFYTLDGNDPSTSGTRYAGPIALHKSAVLRAVALSKNGRHLNSPIFYWKYTCYMAFSPMPQAIPPSTHFDQPITVSLTIAGHKNDSGCAIYYTTDNSTPTIFSTRYYAPVMISQTTDVKAIAVYKKLRPSKVVHELYEKGKTPVVPKAVITPGGGEYGDGIPPVTLACPLDKAMIMYTIDGTEPTMACNLWTGKSLVLEAPVTLKVKVFKSDWIPSVTVAEQYEYETLPEPVANFPTGSVFTDTLTVELHVPGFTYEPGLHIHYTLDGTVPTEQGMLYDLRKYIRLSQSCTIKAIARKYGYYTSAVSTYEYFNMVKVDHAFYKDVNHDGAIDHAFVIFTKPCTVPPSLIEFTDPYTFKKIKITDCRLDTTGRYAHRRVRIPLPKAFGTGGRFAPGHYGRIPLPGEFDTAPFCIHDSTGVAGRKSVEKNGGETAVEAGIIFNEGNIAIVNNPFFPEKSVLPQHIQMLNEFRATTGTAVLFKPQHPSIGSVDIYDALGNRIIIQKNLVEDPQTGILYLIWDGRNSKGRFVGQGNYQIVLAATEKQSGNKTERTITVTIDK